MMRPTINKAKEVFDIEKEEGLRAIIRRFSSEHMSTGEEYIKTMWDIVKVFAIEIEYISGKGA